MGEGYGCSNFQCSTLANEIKLQAGCPDKEVFLYIKDDTPILGHKGQYTTAVGSPCMLYM